MKKLSKAQRRIMRRVMRNPFAYCSWTMGEIRQKLYERGHLAYREYDCGDGWIIWALDASAKGRKALGL